MAPVAVELSAQPLEALDVDAYSAYQQDVAFQMYDATRGDRTVRSAEKLTVRDGLIASSAFVTGMAAFTAFARPDAEPELRRWYIDASVASRRPA